MTYCSFSDNKGNFGGGIFLSTTSGIAVSHCSFASNRALMGAGVYVKDSNSYVGISDCYFRNNTALPMDGNLQGGSG